MALTCPVIVVAGITATLSAHEYRLPPDWSVAEQGYDGWSSGARARSTRSRLSKSSRFR
jgi:hypothetical protein